MAAHHLPQYPGPFVGRLTEIAEITNRLNDPNCRLLTLVGPGGIGKTRLAIQVVARFTSQFDHDVYFVPLQPLNSPEFMVSTIADAVGCQFHPGGDPKQQLLGYFREKKLLLILDNLEHLSDGAALLSEILQAAPHTCILATSRERLNLLEEWVFEVQVLNYPENEAETDIESYDSVQVFLYHARRVQAGFALTPVHKPAIILICRLTGGMPLGIELAAAWVRVLSCEAIADEIAHSLDILETSTLNMEPRHRSMRAAIEPTWNRLTDEERRVFKKLSVFRGSFTREAAKLVAGASLPTLTAMVDKSLVRVDANGRFDLHELLRQYAEERLNETADEAVQTHDRHCSYYAHFLEIQWPRLTGSEIKSTLQDINIELENVRRAWDWAVNYQKAEAIEAMLDSLWFFYDTESRLDLDEGILAFARAAHTLKASIPQEAGVWAKVLARQGALYMV